MRWREDAAHWLNQRGSDQWNNAGLNQDAFRHRVTKSIHDGDTWIAEDDDGTPLGTIAVDSTPDPGLWSPDELRRAYVIHRMITVRSASGRGIGTLMLDHADTLARADGRTALILDAWTSNRDLHAYYESQGFRQVRTVTDHYTPSATLFERAVPPTSE
ncbi:MAG: GNAT family N-acetyltransferase [Pseudonocardiaceae bacterium]